MTKESAIKELYRLTGDKNLTGAEYNAINLGIKALECCEVWRGMRGYVVAPKGTFEKIYEDAK